MCGDTQTRWWQVFVSRMRIVASSFLCSVCRPSSVVHVLHVSITNKTPEVTSPPFIVEKHLRIREHSQFGVFCLIGVMTLCIRKTVSETAEVKILDAFPPRENKKKIVEGKCQIISKTNNYIMTTTRQPNKRDICMGRFAHICWVLSVVTLRRFFVPGIATNLIIITTTTDDRRLSSLRRNGLLQALPVKAACATIRRRRCDCFSHQS